MSIWSGTVVALTDTGIKAELIDLSDPSAPPCVIKLNAFDNDIEEELGAWFYIYFEGNEVRFRWPGRQLDKEQILNAREVSNKLRDLIFTDP